MIAKKMLLGSLFTAGIAATPAFAGVGVIIEIGIPPPAVVVEAPPPRVGYVWAPGYWAWHRDRHIWIGGRWVVERPGYYWVPERWEPVGGRWRFEQGHWANVKHWHKDKGHRGRGRGN